MSHSIEQINVDLTKVERTYKFIGYVPRNGIPSVDICREIVWLDAEGTAFGSPQLKTVNVSWENLTGKSWQVGDQTITAEQIFTVLAQAFDEASV